MEYLKEGDIYLNVKSGNFYEIISMAIDCTNGREGESVIVYKPSAIRSAKRIYARSTKEFLEKFEKHE